MANHLSHLAGSAPRRQPGVERYLEKRAGDAQARLADVITAFAGSMPFVYVHVLAFAGWMVFAEGSPWPTLTLVVSLEAIFLSTFVMIGQNRQAAVQQAKADHDFVEQELELSDSAHPRDPRGPRRRSPGCSRRLRRRSASAITGQCVTSESEEPAPSGGVGS